MFCWCGLDNGVGYFELFIFFLLREGTHHCAYFMDKRIQWKRTVRVIIISSHFTIHIHTSAKSPWIFSCFLFFIYFTYKNKRKGILKKNITFPGWGKKNYCRLVNELLLEWARPWPIGKTLIKMGFRQTSISGLDHEFWTTIGFKHVMQHAFGLAILHIKHLFFICFTIIDGDLMVSRKFR